MTPTPEPYYDDYWTQCRSRRVRGWRLARCSWHAGHNTYGTLHRNEQTGWMWDSAWLPRRRVAARVRALRAASQPAGGAR